jgi:hypothetical protein
MLHKYEHFIFDPLNVWLCEFVFFYLQAFSLVVHGCHINLAFLLMNSTFDNNKEVINCLLLATNRDKDIRLHLTKYNSFAQHSVCSEKQMISFTRSHKI